MDPNKDTQYQSGEYQPYQAPSNEAPLMTDNPEKPYYEQSQQLNCEQPQQPVDQNQDIEKNNYETEEEQNVLIEHMVRRGFIIKTYGILISQLVITLCFILISLIEKVRQGVRNNGGLFYSLLIISVVATVVILVMFVCFRNLARNTPINYILLFTFTVCMSYYCFCACLFYDQRIVIEALTLTTASTIGLTVYAFKTKDDYTYWGFVLFSLLFVIPLAALSFIWFPIIYMLCIITAGIVIYSLYIVYDTQLILGQLGLSYRIDDYVLAALNLYIDIIYLFIRLLELLGIFGSK